MKGGGVSGAIAQRHDLMVGMKVPRMFLAANNKTKD